jgi:hypothetical protein
MPGVSETDVAGRLCPRVYRTSGRADAHRFLVKAFEAANGRVIYASEHTRAPVFIGVEFDERIGVLCYPFRATQNVIRNRPANEHRLQIRYGAEPTWLEEHPLAFDVAGVDTTVVLGAHLEAGIFIGLDPALYDPLPMGISIEFKDDEVKQALRSGWHGWERVNRAGRRRATARSRIGLETLIGFRPEQIERYLRLEQEATELGLDPVLRLRAAQAVVARASRASARHALEETFHLTSRELLEIIASRKRLQVAVRGGVAEHHLLKTLERDQGVTSVRGVDQDGPPDAEVELRGGRTLRVECKNGEENKYANGDGRVEVQKTRASKGDPASRYYEPAQFDVLAVCLWPAAGPPRFVYKNTRDLPRHPDFPDRLGVLHRIDASWTSRLEDAA